MLHEAQYSTRQRAGMVQGMTTSTFPQHDDENFLSAVHGRGMNEDII